MGLQTACALQHQLHDSFGQTQQDQRISGGGHDIQIVILQFDPHQ